METVHRHKKFKGEPKTRQQKRSIEMRGNVDKSKQNDAGYYEGMPGVTVDEYGNRVFMTFLVTPEAEFTSMIFAHPKLAKEAISKAMESNKMIHQIVKAATFEAALTEKTFLNRVFMFLYKRQFKRQARIQEKIQKALHEAQIERNNIENLKD
jgi:hypothetical protein